MQYSWRCTYKAIKKKKKKNIEEGKEEEEIN